MLLVYRHMHGMYGQYDLVYKVIPDPICGNVSSVAWLVIADNKLYTDSMTWFTRSFQIPFLWWFPLSLVQNLFIADQFGKICKTAKITFSLMCQLLFGVQNNCDDPLQQHAHLMLFTVKALYPLQGTGVKSERKKYCLTVQKPWYIEATSKWLD